jgi:regulator of protease activity HflC (stomatin/prohibitin superfamily)
MPASRARRSRASMTLEEILTNRNRLSEDILRDVKEAAAGYGVTVLRADVKDLVFPGNLQEIMNRVLAAERMNQV